MLRNRGILFCHIVTRIRKSAINKNKVSLEKALLYREGKVILHIDKEKQNVGIRLSYGNYKSYKQYAEDDGFPHKKKKSGVFGVFM